MKKRRIHYTLRRVPPQVDEKLKERAHDERRSLNEVALEALERGLGLTDKRIRHHDLDDLAVTWVEDSEFDRVIEDMDQIDPELWN